MKKLIETLIYLIFSLGMIYVALWIALRIIALF